MELEELAAQPVARPRPTRVSLTAVIGMVGLLGLLAAGFGALGGRADPTSPSGAAAPTGAVAVASPGVGASPTVPPPTPVVTPFRACAALGDAPPAIYLRVDGDPTPGTLRVKTAGSSTPPRPAASPVEIPADAITQVWIEGAVCAVAWDFAVHFDDGQVFQVGLQENPSLNPAYASQNRFDVPLVTSRSDAGKLELRANLSFQRLAVEATWPIRILPFDIPVPRLLLGGEDRSFPVFGGCNLVVTFRNGFEEGHLCEGGDVTESLGSAVKVEPGAPLRLVFDDWSVVESVAKCGHVEDGVFEPLRPGCWPEAQDGIIFVAPPAGDIAIAIDACAVHDATGPSARICGTWYVRVDTR